GDLVPGLVTDDGRPERRTLGEHLDVDVAGTLAGAEEEDLLLAGDRRGDDHAGLDDAVVRRSLTDVGVAEQLGELVDPPLHLALLLARRVVAAVLLEVSLGAGGLDALGDLGASGPGQVLELGLEAV